MIFISNCFGLLFSLSGSPFELTRYNVQQTLYNRIQMHGTYLVHCEYRIMF